LGGRVCFLDIWLVGSRFFIFFVGVGDWKMRASGGEQARPCGVREPRWRATKKKPECTPRSECVHGLRAQVFYVRARKKMKPPKFT